MGTIETTLPLDQVLRESGQTLLLRIPQGSIGERLCNQLGALFLTVLNDLMFIREQIPEHLRPRLHLYLDEYGPFATSATKSLLTEGRKFNIGTVIAHQTRSQLEDPENRAAELQVGTLVCFRLIPEDSQELSGNFPVKPEPQWEERVEEIEGTEPVLLPTRKPVEHLLQYSHTREEVNKVVREYLVPIEKWRLYKAHLGPGGPEFPPQRSPGVSLWDDHKAEKL
jgi:hypothetical protein